MKELIFCLKLPWTSIKLIENLFLGSLNTSGMYWKYNLLSEDISLKNSLYMTTVLFSVLFFVVKSVYIYIPC